MPQNTELARLAFDAYNQHGPRAGLTHDGKPVPRWDELGDSVRDKWTASAEAVRMAVLSETQNERLTPPGVFAPMSFGDALRALEEGKRVARQGWNGKGMWLALVPAHIQDLRIHEGERVLPLLPWIGMRTAGTGCFVPWLASQSDVLSKDWMEVSGG